MNPGWTCAPPPPCPRVPCFLKLMITAVHWGPHCLSFLFPESLRDSREKMTGVTLLCKLLSQYCIFQELFSESCAPHLVTDPQKPYRGHSCLSGDPRELKRGGCWPGGQHGPLHGTCKYSAPGRELSWS